MRALSVLSAGVFSTLQDGGRPGQRRCTAWIRARRGAPKWGLNRPTRTSLKSTSPEPGGMSTCPSAASCKWMPTMWSAYASSHAFSSLSFGSPSYIFWPVRLRPMVRCEMSLSMASALMPP
jgi:hypothetical protein